MNIMLLIAILQLVMAYNESKKTKETVKKILLLLWRVVKKIGRKIIQIIKRIINKIR